MIIQRWLDYEGCICRGRHACTYTASLMSSFVCMYIICGPSMDWHCLRMGLRSCQVLDLRSHPHCMCFTLSFTHFSVSLVSLSLSLYCMHTCHFTFKMLWYLRISLVSHYRGFVYALYISLCWVCNVDAYLCLVRTLQILLFFGWWHSTQMFILHCTIPAMALDSSMQCLQTEGVRSS